MDKIKGDIVMKLLKKVAIVISIVMLILIALFVMIVVMAMKDLEKQEKENEEQQLILDSEIEKIFNLLAESKISEEDMEIKTKGEYAVIEKTIKEYSLEWQQITNKCNELVEGNELEHILKGNEIEKSHIYFQNQKEKLNSREQQIEEAFNKYDELADMDRTSKIIDDKAISDYGKEIYKSYFDKSKQIEDDRKTMSLWKENLIEEVEIMKRQVDFLDNTMTNWRMVKEEITFNNNRTYEEYMKIIEELKQVQKEMIGE